MEKERGLGRIQVSQTSPHFAYQLKNHPTHPQLYFPAPTQVPSTQNRATGFGFGQQNRWAFVFRERGPYWGKVDQV